MPEIGVMCLPLCLLEAQPVPKGHFRRRIGPHSLNASIATLDRRTNAAKVLKKITSDLLDHLGDPTAPQRLIVQGAAFKALRVALFADRMLNDDDAPSEKGDHNLLAWSNSLRLDLQALGLERRERATIDLATYLARGRAETTADAPADAATTGETTADAPADETTPADAA